MTQIAQMRKEEEDLWITSQRESDDYTIPVILSQGETDGGL